MPPPTQEAPRTLPGSTRLRDLGLTITGTPLDEVLQAFQAELRQRGITRVQPQFYLSTEWGVPFGTVSIAIPFYLARLDLTELHAVRAGHIEGAGRADILRYLRHEMGHVVNYAYRLYQEAEWMQRFGDINEDYVEEYRPRPFSPDHVTNLPGWYAQKHPDEDWSESFAVWLTPGLDWRRAYAGRPAALAKLEYCDRTMAALRDRDPPVTAEELDEDVGQLDLSLDDYYQAFTPPTAVAPPELDDALETVFTAPGAGPGTPQPAANLIHRLEGPLLAEVYRWTGYFPERTRALLRQVADRASQRQLVYPEGREPEVAVALAALVTALALSQLGEGRELGLRTAGKAEERNHETHESHE
jgi:hypothetical protein